MEDKKINTEIPAKLRVSDKDIEISGSEEFVSAQIQKLESLFTRFLKEIEHPNQQHLISLNSENNAKIVKVEENHEFIPYEILGANKFENVLAINKDDIQVLTDIPGDSLKQRMINLILIYMFIKSQENKTSISFSELRGFCEKHGEVDKPNFAKIMSTQKRFFLISTDHKATLTVPGKKEAQKLLESLNNQFK
jgi:hypothetical protein